MKRLNLNFVIILVVMALWMISCKENKDHITPTGADATEMRDRDDGSSMGDDVTGETEREGSNVGSGSAGTQNGTSGSGSSVAKRDFSGDGSDGMTSGTAVNKAKNVQVENRGNAAESRKSGYSAPDGTPAENRDGDMYTKHDTTRMPSGSTPIK